jgi:O-antigen/teichoic acid export membrane protein
MPVVKGALAKSSLRTIAIMGGRIATQGVTLVLVTRLLGPEIYGGYVAAASLAMILGLLPNLGSGYILMARAARDRQTVGDTWSYGWPLSLLLGAALALAFPFVSRGLTGGTLTLADLAIIGVAELMVSPITLLLSFALQAVGRVPLGQVVLTMPMLLRAIAAGACLAVDHVPVGAFVIFQACAAFGGLAAAWSIAARAIDLRVRVRRPTREELVTGSGYAAMHVVAANPTELDKITSPLLLGDHAAGIYSATSRIMNAIAMPVVGMLLTAQPRLFRHAAFPNPDGHRLISLLWRISFAWGLLGTVAMLVASPWIPLLFGPAFADTAALIPWVAAAAPFLTLRLASGTILVALGHPLQRMRFELAGMVLLAVLLPTGSRLGGPRGMALALAAAEMGMAIYGWLLVRRAERRL